MISTSLTSGRPIVSNTRLTIPDARLRELAARVLELARAAGATAAETEVSEGAGQTVTVRKGEVETLEYNKDKGVSVTVYLGQRRGHAATSDFSAEALARTVDKALAIARYTAEDACAGLADAELLARDYPDLELYHPWDLSVEEAIERARACESAALAVDARIVNSEGATVSTQESHFIYANTLGFMGGYPSSRHSVSCAVVAEEGGAMQRDYWYDSARAAEDMAPVETIGRRAGERTVRRLNARRIATRQCPVLFEAPVASSLIAHFVSAVSGGHLYRKSSFLLDSLGRQVFPAFVRIEERPHLKRGLASAPFDHEGVATHDRDVVSGGVVQGYFLGSYSARKLKMKSTGNAGGNHNLIVPSTGEDFDALLKKMGSGLLVTELLGHGLNMVTGDYSRGAAGFWVEDGAIAHPVEEITVAGNLQEMFMGIVAIGSDVERRGSRRVGSILIERMTVAGE
ncbi:MAG: metalloprotease PmbA [Thiobacillaceae bacterium]|nr:metalloprotease PmbA [Thiobacillaceae bacterium]